MDSATLTAYAAEIAAAKSRREASTYLFTVEDGFLTRYPAESGGAGVKHLPGTATYVSARMRKSPDER